MATPTPIMPVSSDNLTVTAPVPQPNSVVAVKFLTPESKSLFPLQTITDLEKLFEIECISKEDPNLAVFSIILGCIEDSLVNLDYSSAPTTSVGTSNGNNVKRLFGGNTVGGVGEDGTTEMAAGPARVGAKRRGSNKKGRPSLKVNYKYGKKVKSGEGDEENSKRVDQHDGEGEESLSDKENLKGDFPALELDLLEALFLKFYDILRTHIDAQEEKRLQMQVDGSDEGTSRFLVKKVSDVLWSYLSRNYKPDTPHIQSLYAYLTGRKLDRYGVSVAVTAGSQLLGLSDVHLVLSEDHSWVGFGGLSSNGPGFQHTSEVTWHGKGIEDKRGLEVRQNGEENSWLYLKGHAVDCTTRHMEIAAIIASMNYRLQPTTVISTEIVKIQQRLLWKLYDDGHLKKYPHGLMVLADLEELLPSIGKPDCRTLYQEAMLSSRTFYGDMHIYPYTTYAAYCFRQEDYKSALKYWAHAARIVQKFRRCKNDEEIYREFFEISSDALTKVMKNSSVGFSANSVLRDPASFAHLLRFFDGICTWEEKSMSNIVHITWAKSWNSAIAKFDYTIRRMVRIVEGSSAVDKNGKRDLTKEVGMIDDEFEKDSGIDDDDEPSPCVTLFSQKMKQLKDFFKTEKYNASAVTLILTAQTATTTVDTTNDDDDGASTSSGDKKEVGIATGRTRRERLSQQNKQNSTSKLDYYESSTGKGRKRSKISL